MKSIHNIFEATDKKLSKDFEIIGSGYKADTAKAYLKALNLRQEELGLNYDDCRAAAKAFKQGDFEKALKIIWGNKVRIEEVNLNDSLITKRIYSIDGYAEFTETIEHSPLGGYIHSIKGEYFDNLAPSYGLGQVLYVAIKKMNSNNISYIEKINKEAFLSKPVAHIYNILFVGFEGRELTSSLSKVYLKLKNKL